MCGVFLSVCPCPQWETKNHLVDLAAMGNQDMGNYGSVGIPTWKMEPRLDLARGQEQTPGISSIQLLEDTVVSRNS